MNQNDYAHKLTWGLSISTTGSTSSVNGTGVDFRDCGPDVTAIFKVGPNNPGNDTTVAWHLEESHDDSTYVDIASATGTSVSGDATGFEVVTFLTRARRYVRAVATLTGTSPTPDLTAILSCCQRRWYIRW